MDNAKDVANAITIFISYAPQDEALLHEFEKHLTLLRKQGIITTWYRHKVLAGTDWKQALDEQLESASVVLLLISVDFLNSDYCYGVEMQRALARHAAGTARVIPVLFRPAYLQEAPFDHLQCLPPNRQPITKWSDRDEAFQEVVAGIHSVIRDLCTTQKKLPSEKERKLRALLADHSGFLQDRLKSFVGRQPELEEIRQLILTRQQTGGYITITGQAGQGKSSIIAKLVEEYGVNQVASHFIPFNPGPDHQIGLLRNLMTRLILKYGLSENYVASESRAALRDYFPRVLEELVGKGGQEVIFIDGLDQLEEEFSGVRDLSFLPNNPPPGVVFVLGTRPNDTLRPLELLKPYYEYPLPNLSRNDFDLILEQRGVQLDKRLANRFYQAMQENALYLDLVAKELTEGGITDPKGFIRRVAHNPENIFSLSIARLKRRPVQWRVVIKPALGVLLAAREPLSLRHIRRLVEE